MSPVLDDEEIASATNHLAVSLSLDPFPDPAESARVMGVIVFLVNAVDDFS